METIKVIWPSYHPDAINRGYWDQGILENLFDRPGPFTWEHQNDFDIMGEAGAVVVLNGRMHVEDTEKINADIAKLTWCVFIITGDEEALFPWQEIKHPMLRTWVQLPRMNVHNDVSFRLPNGPRPNTRELLKGLPIKERPVDFAFMGQINHDRREQCVEAAKELQKSAQSYTSFLTETEGFGEEKVPYEHYLDILAETKIVLCPSGIESPDTFRLYEALEAGCLPIVDQFSTRHQSPGFWQYLFGADIPFPIVDYWDKLPALLPELLRDYPHNANRASAWWQNFKRSMHYKLINDIREISR